MDALSGRAVEQREAWGNASEAASPASSREDPIAHGTDGIDAMTAVNTAAANKTGLAGGM